MIKVVDDIDYSVVYAVIKTKIKLNEINFRAAINSCKKK